MVVATGFEPAKLAHWLLRPAPLTAREHYQIDVSVGVGFEPTTYWLTANRSAAELHNHTYIYVYIYL